MNHEKVITFTIGNVELAVKSDLVEEIFVLTNITRVPVAPAFMNWVGNWQGHIIPIIDLSPFLSQKLKGIVSKKTGLVLGSVEENNVFALVVDNIGTTDTLQVVAGPESELPYFAESRVLRDENMLWLISASKIKNIVSNHIGHMS